MILRSSKLGITETDNTNSLLLFLFSRLWDLMTARLCHKRCVNSQDHMLVGSHLRGVQTTLLAMKAHNAVALLLSRKDIIMTSHWFVVSYYGVTLSCMASTRKGKKRWIYFRKIIRDESVRNYIKCKVVVEFCFLKYYFEIILGIEILFEKFLSEKWKWIVKDYCAYNSKDASCYVRLVNVS